MALGRGKATLQGAWGEGVGLGVPSPLAGLWLCLFSLQCWRIGAGALWELGSVPLSAVFNLLKQFLFTLTAGACPRGLPRCSLERCVCPACVGSGSKIGMWRLRLRAGSFSTAKRDPGWDSCLGKISLPLFLLLPPADTSKHREQGSSLAQDVQPRCRSCWKG